MRTVQQHSTIFRAFIALVIVAVISYTALNSWNSKIMRSFKISPQRTISVLDTLQRDMQNGTKRHNSPQYLKTSMKFYMAFSYSEQLSMATENLLALAALAAYSGRNVVVPFVNNSMFTARNPRNETQSLALYYNLSAFNSKLRSRGYSALVSWESFLNVCRKRLDLLLHFIYGKEATNLRQKGNDMQSVFFPCSGRRKHKDFFEGFKITRTVCVDVGILRSVEKFHSKVIKGSPCVGIVEWRGNGTLTSFRAKFPLPLNIHRPLSRSDCSSFFNETMLKIARDFKSNSLANNYISVHIRSEKILKRPNGSILALLKCFKEIAAQIQKYRDPDHKRREGNIRKQEHIQNFLDPKRNHREGKNQKIFVAVDFLASGSKSFGVLPARNAASSLVMHLKEVLDNPVFFQPHVYNLFDGGSVAIVEMIILASGSQLLLAGGGSFQGWIRQQFMERNKEGYAKVHSLCTE